VNDDKTSTPDGSDERGAVVTGEETVQVPAQKATAEKSPGQKTPEQKSESNGTVSTAKPAADPAEPADESTDEHTVPDKPATDAKPADPAAQDGPVSGDGDGSAGSDGKAAGASGDAPTAQMDAPTAQMNVPSGGNGKSTTPPSPSKAQSGNPAPSPKTAPSPTPAPGPVPAPGPAAATPPPWRRVPGQETAQPQAQPQSKPQPKRTEQAAPPPPQSDRPAGGLLDQGPTQFLEREPSRGAPSGAPQTQAAPVGGWSAVRAVRNRPPRQAALQLKRLDPWSVLKLALVLAVVLFFIWLVAVGVLYGVLDGMGVWDRLNGTYADLVLREASGQPLISAGRVFGLAAVIGAINSLLFAVAMTVGAFVYNVSADLVGGIEVTLSERD
jgi:Transmembrane domain of unknown function (DUF3566)